VFGLSRRTGVGQERWLGSPYSRTDRIAPRNLAFTTVNCLSCVCKPDRLVCIPHTGLAQYLLVAESMTPSLQRAIEDIYGALRDVRRPATVDGCPCCIGRMKIGTLLSKPLRDLSPDDLSHYAASAFLTVGAVEDFLYFLPRILEISALEPDWWPDPEVVTCAIHSAGFHSWPGSRRQVVSRFFDEMVIDLLATEGRGFELDSWVCAIARLHVDLAPLLAQIAANRARLIEWYEVNSRPLIDGRLANGFWDEAPKERKQVVEWFQSPQTQQIIQEQYGLA